MTFKWDLPPPNSFLPVFGRSTNKLEMSEMFPSSWLVARETLKGKFSLSNNEVSGTIPVLDRHHKFKVPIQEGLKDWVKWILKN